MFGSGWHDATGQPDEDRCGIVCFITVAGFLNGPGFQKMREDLRRDSSEIWVVDCSPEGHQPDVRTRIFQGVQQPVCIVLAARAGSKNRETPARLRYFVLPEGRRESKFKALAKLSLAYFNLARWSGRMAGPLPSGTGHCLGKISSLPELFVWSGSGVTLHRTWPISPDEQTLERRWEVLRKEKDQAKKEELFHPDRDRNITKKSKPTLGRITYASDGRTGPGSDCAPASVRFPII